MEPTIPNRTDQEKPSHSPRLLANPSHLNGVQIIDHEVRNGTKLSFWLGKKVIPSCTRETKTPETLGGCG